MASRDSCTFRDLAWKYMCNLLVNVLQIYFYIQSTTPKRGNKLITNIKCYQFEKKFESLGVDTILGKIDQNFTILRGCKFDASKKVGKQQL
jgi:hypothetical protein